MKVSKAMVKQTECVGPNDSVAQAQSLMKSGHFKVIPVFDHAKVSGTLVDSEIHRRAESLGRTVEQLKVGELMNPDTSVALGEEEQSVAEERMVKSRLSSLPVVDVGGKLVGVLAHQVASTNQTLIDAHTQLPSRPKSIANPPTPFSSQLPAFHTPPFPIHTREHVAQRAYQIWQECGSPEGYHNDHWFQAEDELVAICRVVAASEQFGKSPDTPILKQSTLCSTSDSISHYENLARRPDSAVQCSD